MKSIVIGSGFGGIASALRLKAKGHDVILIEKQKDLAVNRVEAEERAAENMRQKMLIKLKTIK